MKTPAILSVVLSLAVLLSVSTVPVEAGKPRGHLHGSVGPPSPVTPVPGLAVQPGDPLPGLSGQEIESFETGLEDFSEVEEADEGLGPAFNGLGCAQCHATPAVGGISPVSEVRAGYVDERGRFNVLGGTTLFHLFAIPDQRCQPVIPLQANVIAHRSSIPVFGAGLVEKIPDETILALQDPFDRNGDGISGRAAIVDDVATGRKKVGRFGWKAQQATLLSFSGDAYLNEMGITNDLFPSETGAGIGPEAMQYCDAVPDPEDERDPATGKRGIDNFEAFMKFLAPIQRGPVNSRVIQGENIFNSIGCASCHKPILLTGRSDNPVFDRKPVPVFSDLLLHDVGTGDGIPQAAAQANEIRTPSLWGLRFRRPLLHDGSAATTWQAIQRHGSEADAVTDRYRRLRPDEKALLFAFLDSL